MCPMNTNFIYEIKETVESLGITTNAEEWDNTGVLIDSNTISTNKDVLLTINLTEEVVEEAVKKGLKYVIAYHPIIFKPLKNITDQILINCIKNDISVYCPHTKLDQSMNNFLLDLVKGMTVEKAIIFFKEELKSVALRVTNINVNRKTVITEENLLVFVGSAIKPIDCFNKIIIAGEMSHHSLLHCKRNNSTVILLEHSNSERLYLTHLKHLLSKKLNIFISKADKDPVDLF
ncbi:hypothetical protein NUSPORA_01153 [Nucleospora cyclopteri]